MAGLNSLPISESNSLAQDQRPEALTEGADSESQRPFYCVNTVFILTLTSDLSFFFFYKRLARTGIIVTTSEAVLLQLVADKDHPKFKEIQNLIKASAPESGLLSKV